MRLNKKGRVKITSKVGLEKPIKLSDYYNVKQVSKRAKNGKWDNWIQITGVKLTFDDSEIAA